MRRAAISLMALVVLSAGWVGLGRTEERMTFIPDVVYRYVDGVVLTLDVYRPSDEGPHPAVVAVHGGSWWRGDKSQWQASAPALTQAGFAVFAIEYRLAPPGGNAGFGDAPRDVRRAVAWVKEQAAIYGVDPDAVSLLGSSAGAHLALIAGQRDATGVSAVAAWSPPVDLAALSKEGLARAVRGFIGCTFRQCPGRYERMSPLRRVERFDPPTFLASSSAEVIPDTQVRAMARRLRNNGVTARLSLIAGTAHGQELRPYVIADTISFLRTHLSQT